MFHKLSEVLNVHLCFISKGKGFRFAAALRCLVDMVIIGRSNKGHPLNCLEDMISREVKKFENNHLLFDMVPRSSPFRMPLIDSGVAKALSMVSG